VSSCSSPPLAQVRETMPPARVTTTKTALSSRSSPPHAPAREPLPLARVTTTKTALSSRSSPPHAPAREPLPLARVTTTKTALSSRSSPHFATAGKANSAHVRPVKTTRFRYTRPEEPTPASGTDAHQPQQLDAKVDPMAAIAARKTQVDKLREGERMPAIVMPWPQASAATAAHWADRHPAFRTTTAGYQSTQLRMLWLFDVPHNDRLARFERECWVRQLKPTTAESYWT
jgi:hypothetical protein